MDEASTSASGGSAGRGGRSFPPARSGGEPSSDHAARFDSAADELRGTSVCVSRPFHMLGLGGFCDR